MLGARDTNRATGHKSGQGGLVRLLFLTRVKNQDHWAFFPKGGTLRVLKHVFL
jgi:hypothetical protein